MTRNYLFNISIFLLLFSQNSLFAQDKEIKKADEYYFDFNYNKAISHYKKIIEKGEDLFYVTHRIGDCYRQMGQIKESVEWYLKALDYPNVDFSTFLLLSQQLKKLEHYEESNQYLRKYYELSGNEKSVTLTKRRMELLRRDYNNFVVHNLPINTAYSEIGPAIYNDQLIFSSNKGLVSATQRKDVRNNEYFYKIYSSKINTLRNFSKPKIFSRKLTTKYNDGPITFNKDYTLAFVTRNYSNKDNPNAYLNIFIVDKNNAKWNNNATPIPLYEMDCSFMHGFLTNDEERFFFVSDMKGGYGGLDIYYSYVYKGILSSPINLGPQVNSSGNEMFPYISEDNILYYSSDKEGSLGGLDVFFAMPVDDGFSNSFNMGYPINSSKDDFGFIYLENNKNGYYVSNRDGGEGQDDIYAFEQLKSYDLTLFTGIIYTSQKKIFIPDAIVNIYKNSELILSTITNEKGEFSFYLDDLEEMKIEVKNSFFETFTSDLKDVIQSKDEGFYIELNLDAN